MKARPRFVVVSVHGYATSREGGGGTHGVTYSVLDRVYNAREVGRFRSEDRSEKKPRSRFAPKDWRQGGIVMGPRRAKRQAEELAAELNAKHGTGCVPA